MAERESRLWRLLDALDEARDEDRERIIREVVEATVTAACKGDPIALYLFKLMLPL